jgi:hypothetical protein
MSEDKKYISSVKMVDGTVCEIKDAEARKTLEDMAENVIIFNGGSASTVID